MKQEQKKTKRTKGAVMLGGKHVKADSTTTFEKVTQGKVRIWIPHLKGYVFSHPDRIEETRSRYTKHIPVPPYSAQRAGGNVL